MDPIDAVVPGEDLDLAALLDGCATEPIHAPGAVQPHGALLATDAGGMIRVASANCETIVGFDAATAVGCALADIVGDESAARLAEADPGDVVEVDLLAGPCEATVHRGGGFDLIEIEPAVEPARDDQARLQRALLRFHGAPDSMALLAQAAAVVQDLTGFDRVMVYRFDAEWNGEVVVEVARPDLEPFLGLRYPASDIPPQARALYSRTRLRLIPDATATPSPLLVAVTTDLGQLDLSAVSIRAVSPVHLRYLTNMGVRASMSVAIHIRGALWGLIACHHATEPLHPSVRVRNAVDLVGQTTSTVLGALLAAESATTHRLLLDGLDAITEPLRLEAGSDPAATMAATGDLLPALLGSHGAAVVNGNRTLTIGRCPPQAVVDGFIALASARGRDLLASAQLGALDAHWAADADTAAGALAVRAGTGDQWLIWFRPETARVIRWGGDPNGKEATVSPQGDHQLDPRASFAEYLEHVRGTSTPWSGEQQAVARLAAARLGAMDVLGAQREATIASTVQRAVMLETFPPIPGVDGAARYAPCTRDPIGGDWYDVFVPDDGRPVIALGDVAGHGLSAAATMAQLRHALRAYVIREDSPAEAMTQLNELMRTLLPGDMATAMIVSLDPVARSADIVSAGHLPAVVVSPDGAVLVEGAHHDRALGAARNATYRSTRVDLPPGHTLVLYTDGLIEQRTSTLDARLGVLLDVAASGAHLPTGDLCEHLMAELVRGSDHHDDVTALAIRLAGP
ncbi:MAG: bphP [Ilumatobacteraceae bacterium]|nr:bphP [Ilumatobacteraceae bacterium]